MADKPSIVMIVMDALRADCAPGAPESAHLRNLGLRRPNLPAFSSLVEGAFGFTQAIACASYTSACHASLFTGLVPAEHGVRAFSVTSLSRDVRTLAEILTDAGYATCALSDQPIFFQPQGLLRGFQLFVREDDEALSWWDSYEGTPRFLFMHLWDVHQPYGMPVGHAYRSSYPQIIESWKKRLRSRGIAIPPARDTYYDERERYQVGLMQQIWQEECGFKAGVEDYLAGLTTFDGGRMSDLAGALRARGVLDSAITIITADHGEGRARPPAQILRHGDSLSDDNIGIPLFMKLPGLAETRALPDQVSQVDIMATILDALDMSGQQTAGRSRCNGRSLLPLLRGQGLPAQPAYAEISTVYKDPTAQIAEQGPERRPMIRYRTLRYPDRKYWLVGKPVTMTDDILSAPAEDMLDVLFHDLLGRPSAEPENEEWLKRIQAAPATNVARRRALVERFEAAGEFKYLPKYAIYDLARDPLELKPSDARQKPADWADYQKQMEIMIEIDGNARAGEPLVSNESDEQVVLKRLQGLGYIE
jgi:arylsulfatase A-like enzyme